MNIAKKCDRGFTLIEIMTVLVILGILIGIAIPGYNTYARKSRMAEGSSGLNALFKLQTAYFLFRKEFVILSQNPSTIPTMAKQPFEDMTDWARLGTFYPVGAAMQFSYGAYAGKTDASAAEINLTNSGSHSSASDAWSPSSGDTVCSPPLPLSTFVNLTDKSQYNWVYLYAVANLNKDSNPGESKCTQMTKFLDTNARGDLAIGSAIVVTNPTE